MAYDATARSRGDELLAEYLDDGFTLADFYHDHPELHPNGAPEEWANGDWDVAELYRAERFGCAQYGVGSGR